jgi:hypothetical protein
MLYDVELNKKNMVTKIFQSLCLKYAMCARYGVVGKQHHV